MSNMFKIIITSKKFLLAFAGIALITLTLALLPQKEPQPTLLKTTPADQSLNFKVIGSFIVDYNLAVDSTKFSVKSDPDSNWSAIQRSSNSIEYKPISPLQRYTKYQLTIFWKNQTIHPYSFTTEDTQQDYEVIKNVKDEIAKNYPLAYLIPYETSNYKVIYSTALTLEITSKNPNLTSEELIDEIKSWVAQNGGDASAHKYVIAP